MECSERHIAWRDSLRLMVNKRRQRFRFQNPKIRFPCGVCPLNKPAWEHDNATNRELLPCGFFYELLQPSNLGGRLCNRIAIRSVTRDNNLITIEHDRGTWIRFSTSLGLDNKSTLFGEYDMIKVEFITGNV